MRYSNVWDGSPVPFNKVIDNIGTGNPSPTIYSNNSLVIYRGHFIRYSLSKAFFSSVIL